MNRNTWLAVLGIGALTIALLVAWFLTTEEDSGAADVPVPVTLSFSFDEGAEGWEPGFADFPSDENQWELYEFEADWRELPNGLEGSGLYSRGSNRSDDLMMYWITQIDELVATTSYDVTFELEIATNMPGGMVGIGGSPTESVFIKAGGSTSQPDTEPAEDGFERLTIDLGSQSQDGANGRVIGNFDNPNVDGGAGDPPPYALDTVDGSGLPVSVTTDASGALWVIVATDSGFEGATDIYYSSIAMDLTPN